MCREVGEEVGLCVCWWVGCCVGWLVCGCVGWWVVGCVGGWAGGGVGGRVGGVVEMVLSREVLQLEAEYVEMQRCLR